MDSDKHYQSPIGKQHLATNTHYNYSPQQCPYCLIKQKLSIDDEPKRCLKHSIAYQNSFSPRTNTEQSTNIIEEAVELLREVEQILQDYWNNLHEYSRGNVGKVKSQLNPVFNAVSAIQEKLSRFPIYNQRMSFTRHDQKRSFDGFYSEEIRSVKRERIHTQTFLKYDQLFQESSVNDQIKEWVIYFQKILINRELRDELLPFDDQVDMRIFKQSMQRKFITFANTYHHYQKRLSLALEKLLFYMEACGNAVNDKQLKQDIKFIEETEFNKTSGQRQLQLLVVQALTIQDLLNRENQLESNY